MIEGSRLKDYRPANASFYHNNGQLMVSRVDEATRCVCWEWTHLVGS
jgi:hypothetical protein